MSDAISGLSFEDALTELETIVRGLEGGQQKLEDAITCYERAPACAATARPSWPRRRRACMRSSSAQMAR